MNDLFKVLITVGAVLLLMGLLKINNNRKLKRGFQYPLLFISPVLVAAEVALLVWLRPQLWQWLSQQSWAADVYNAIMTPGGILYCMEILALNVLIVVAYFLIKLIIRPIVTAIMRRGRRMEIAKAFIWDEDYQMWYLREHLKGLRGILRGIIWITALLTMTVCAAAWIAGPGSEFWYYAFPAAALVVLMEFLACYCAMTREEYLASIGGEGMQAAAHRQFNKLREIYEKLFPESLLSSRTGKDFQSRSGSTQLLKELTGSDDQIERIVGNYYLHLRKRKPGSFDVDLVNATNRLLHHESVIIFNPFYRDVSDYITLPVVDTMLNGQKCLVIVGRQSMEENVAQWLTDILAGYARTDRLWQVSSLREGAASCDVGILTFSDLYNLEVINDSEDFLLKTGFVLLVEPSRMLTTSQTGLNIVVEKFNLAKFPTFCALDHESDGLVDLLSHVFQQNVTNVVAAPPIKPTYTAMGWDAAGDYKRQSLFQQQTHFLGNGTELAAVALKYQVDHVDWYSEEKAPVADIRWIAEQYYGQISRYAGLPYEQKSFEDRVHFSSDLWEKQVSDHSFIITEDETCNLFATLRAYLSRGTKQSFVHVFSENYLMRDYMRFNWQMFMSDAKAIPMLSPHYAKTERNTVLRLVLMMASEPVSQEYIEQELQLLGYDGKECYKTLSNLISRYLGIRETIITVTDRVEDKDTLPVSIKKYGILKRTFNQCFANTLKNAFFVVEDEELGSQYIDARLFGHITQLVMPGQMVVYGGKLYKVHSITDQVGCILHRASDEYMRRLYYRQNRKYHLGIEDDTENMPADETEGQGGTIRAKSTKPGPVETKKKEEREVISRRRVGDIEIAVENRCFSVVSNGYLEMKDRNDICTARYIDLTDDPCIKAFRREYKNKAVMSIRLTGTDAATRYTLCLLLSELMYTLFPYSWPYIAVLCKKPAEGAEKTGGLLYDLEGDADSELIYILEDSTMDLGLLEAIDNNLFRILEIVTDYLNWHEEKANETPPVKEPSDIQVEIPIPPKDKRRGLGTVIGSIFGKGRDKGKDKNKGKDKDKGKDGEEGKGGSPAENVPESPAPEAAVPEAAAPAVPAPADNAPEAPVPEGTAAEEKPADEKPAEEKPAKKRKGLIGLLARLFGRKKKKDKNKGKQKEPENSAPEETPADAPAEAAAPAAEPGSPAVSGPAEEAAPEESRMSYRSETVGTGEETSEAVTPDALPDSRSDFLRFGYDGIDPALVVSAARQFLNSHGFGDNNLAAARKGADENAVKLDMNAECFCDFCSRPLNGVSYDRLSDGRIRCQSCTSSAIDDVGEFTDLFFATQMLMEDNYRITYHVPINIRVTDAKTIGALTGRVFVPTTGYDGRVVGFARHNGQDYTLYVENGSPRLATIATTAHEMTHIWQYISWDRKKIKQHYPTKLANDLVYEGMASWTEIQTLYMIGEYTYAQEQEQILEYRAKDPEDVYGNGFLLFREKYGLGRQGDIPGKTPFNTFPPL